MWIGSSNFESYYAGQYTKLWNQLMKKPERNFNEIKKLVDVFNASCGQDQIIPATGTAMLYTLTRWTQGRRVYLFSPELYEELTDMADSMNEDDEIPAEFLRLPFDAISIQASYLELANDYFGTDEFPAEQQVLVELSLCVTTAEAGEIFDCPCLVATLTTKTNNYCSFVIPLRKTVGECIRSAIDFHTNGDHWFAKEMQQVFEASRDPLDLSGDNDLEINAIKQLIQMILYLNSANADFSEPEIKSERKERKRTEQKENVKITDVGYHVGRLLKNAKRIPTVNAGTGNRKRAHFRRAHWHHYWVGKKDGERKQILKWIHVVLVHPDEIDDKPTVMKVERGA